MICGETPLAKFSKFFLFFTHGFTKSPSITTTKADLWRARLAVKTLRRDQREAIAEAGEG